MVNLVKKVLDINDESGLIKLIEDKKLDEDGITLILEDKKSTINKYNVYDKLIHNVGLNDYQINLAYKEDALKSSRKMPLLKKLIKKYVPTVKQMETMLADKQLTDQDKVEVIIDLVKGDNFNYGHLDVIIKNKDLNEYKKTIYETLCSHKQLPLYQVKKMIDDLFLLGDNGTYSFILSSNDSKAIKVYSRKLVDLGKTSQVVTVPKEFIKRHELKSGNKLNVIDKGDYVIVKPK